MVMFQFVFLELSIYLISTINIRDISTPGITVNQTSGNTAIFGSCSTQFLLTVTSQFLPFFHC